MHLRLSVGDCHVLAMVDGGLVVVAVETMGEVGERRCGWVEARRAKVVVVVALLNWLLVKSPFQH